MVIADIQEDRVRFAVENGFADAAVVVPMKRPDTIEAKLEFAKQVAETVKSTTHNGQPLGEVSATFECTGVEACLQASIYVRISHLAQVSNRANPDDSNRLLLPAAAS